MSSAGDHKFCLRLDSPIIHVVSDAPPNKCSLQLQRSLSLEEKAQCKSPCLKTFLVAFLLRALTPALSEWVLAAVASSGLRISIQLRAGPSWSGRTEPICTVTDSKLVYGVPKVQQSNIGED